MPRFSRLCRQRERVRFGAAARENHVLGPRADELGYLDSRDLDGRPRGPSLRVHR